ncbi:hypothetical protein [Nostoc flagelliforme]|uniref:hypothetical protein n=1 Tax=Nostoc flagelliforme TaxID=1306274 RepID=UPI0012FDE199|nr:hypothetical protein [Nostoc flagelliforme]
MEFIPRRDSNEAQDCVYPLFNAITWNSIPRRDRNEAQDCVYPPFNAITWNSIPRRDRNEAQDCPPALSSSESRYII